MLEVKDKNNILLAVLYYQYDLRDLHPNTTTWVGDPQKALQVAMFNYDFSKIFKGHKHIKRPRVNNYTQECIIVFNGELLANLYDNEKNFVDNFIMYSGCFAIFYQGYHEYTVFKAHTRFIEIKNGPFTTVAEDKVYLDE